MVAVRPAVWKRSLENSDTLSMKLHSTGLNPRSPPSSSSDICGPSHFLKPVLWGKLGSPPFIFLSLLLIPKTLHSFCFPVSAFCSILSGAFCRVYYFFFLFPLSVIHSFNSSTCTHPPGMASVFLLCLLSQGPVPSQDVPLGAASHLRSSR